MKLVNTKLLGDIGTAVFYKRHKFLPSSMFQTADVYDYIQSATAVKVLYKGSTSGLVGINDFAEYDFSYNVDKGKYNDTYIPDLLVNSDKDLVGNDVTSLAKIEKVLFPTSTDITETPKDFGYFGTVDISGQTLFVFVVPGITDTHNGIARIELYEGSPTSNNNSIPGFVESDFLEKRGVDYTKPAAVILLGPDASVRNNSSDLYYPYDPQLNEKNLNEFLTAQEYRVLEEEISMDKIVYFMVSSEDIIGSVNIAYKSFHDSVDPGRNMRKWFLRNDEFSKKCGPNRLVQVGNSWVDQTSGTYLGAKQDNIKTPIFNSRKEKESERVKYYNKHRRYEVGDIVEFGTERFESVKACNIGNNPYLSSAWSRVSDITGIFTVRVPVRVNPPNSGTISPSGWITIDPSSPRSFRLYPGVGYDVIPGTTVIVSSGGIPLDPTHFIYTRQVEAGTEVLRQDVQISKWDTVLAGKELVFGFSHVPCKVIPLAYDPILDSYISYTEWQARWSGEMDILYLRKVPTGEIITIPPGSNDISVEVGEEYQFVFQRSSNLGISTVKAGDKSLQITDIPGDPLVTVSGLVIDNSETQVVFKIETRVFTISVETEAPTESSSYFETAYGGKSTQIRLFSTTDIKYVTLTNPNGSPLTIDAVNELGTSFSILGSTITLTRPNPSERIWVLDIEPVTSDLAIKITNL